MKSPAGCRAAGYALLMDSGAAGLYDGAAVRMSRVADAPKVTSPRHEREMKVAREAKL